MNSDKTAKEEPPKKKTKREKIQAVYQHINQITLNDSNYDNRAICNGIYTHASDGARIEPCIVHGCIAIVLPRYIDL